MLRTIRAEIDGLTRTELNRQTRYLQTKESEEILSSLLEAGDIRKAERTTRGRRAMVYVAE